MSTEQSYEVVLKDLEEKHHHCGEMIQRYTDEQKALVEAISTIRRFVPTTQEALPFPSPARETVTQERVSRKVMPPPAAPGFGIYSGISTRWAILFLFAENATGPMGRTDIAKVLTDGGITSNAQSFASNVSPVSSGMAKERNEVEQVGDSGLYQITEHGREVWNGIKLSAQWRSRSVNNAQAQVAQA